MAPQVTAVGIGLGGVGLAAAGVVAPIEKAAQKSGGLAKNMGSLDAEQKQVARSVLGLGKQYDAFQQSLKPQVVGDINAALRIGGHLLRDIQPVSRAAGTALGGVLKQLDAEFASRRWQSFFDFLARTAAPDVHLLGNTFVDLTSVLPPLLEDLQPVGRTLLQLTDTTAKLSALTAGLPQDVAHLGTASKQANTPLGDLFHWTSYLVNPVQLLPKGLTELNKGLDYLDKKSGGAAAPVRDLHTRLAPMVGTFTSVFKASGPAARGIAGAGDSAAGAAGHVRTLAQRVTDLRNAETRSLNTQLDYSNALITSRNDSRSLAQALKASHDRIGLQTQKQRDSFSAANRYISDLEQTAAKAQASGKGIGAQISAISRALPQLRHVSGGTREYWQEVRTLHQWLVKLQDMRSIHRNIIVHGDGTFSIKGPGGIPYPVKARAAGGLITEGTGPRADDVLARVSRGEVIVPADMVKAGAVDHLRGKLPGFAAGGSVTPHLENASRGFLSSFNADMDKAMARAVTAALKSAAAGLGALGGDAAANLALGRRLFPWSASQWPAQVALWTRESGWSRTAENPSSGAYGIPQALPASKLPFAGQKAGGSHAGPQITWGYGYERGRYGNPLSALAHENQFGWYAGGTGGAAPGWAVVGEEGPELVKFKGGEPVLSAAQSSLAAAMAGYAKGTHTPLNEKIDHVLRYVRSHPDQPVWYGRL
ncbi:MAG: hypothetical protein J2P30_00785, partial [Actinobacteria bacterium]|nr:hypothetical protein [Actinomycetota bacterium]